MLARAPQATHFGKMFHSLPEPNADAPEHTSIARQTSNGNANMIVDPNELLLIRRELAG
jgi:hypothetical protein